MELQRLAELIRKYAPAHFRDVSAALGAFSDELEYTKAALSHDLMQAQRHDDFFSAREILDVQEELTRRVALIQNILSEAGAETEEAAVDVTAEEMPAEDNFTGENLAERPDYSLYAMDATVAYDIENTPVTFKRLAAFSYKERRFAVTTWRSLLSQICDILYMENPQIIRNMMREPRRADRKRVKMSMDKSVIHSPVRIADSDIWLETNRSAADIRKSILVLLKRYGIPTEEVKVYFRRDYATLHADDDQRGATQ